MRVETGVRAGDSISPFYDPMIAKLVAHGEDRETALAALSEVLAQTEVAGSTVNTAFLAALASDPDFAAGDVDTGLIGRHQDALTALPLPNSIAAAAAAFAASGMAERPVSDDPWSALGGYAHFHAPEREIRLKYGDHEVPARITTGANNGPAVRLYGETIRLAAVDGQRVALWPGHVTVFDGAVGHTFQVPDPLARAEEALAGTGSLRAPMPGLVKVVRAAKGESVAKGQPLLILEAMKMEHTIAAPHDGVIADIAAEGEQVSDGTVLVKFVEEGQS
jgi:3-methylcrotonyl-CoA carboxylase alpha subunit